jgi:hypothetical protein
MSDEHIAVKIDGVLYVKLDDAKKLRAELDRIARERDEARHFLDVEIDRAPEPLLRLGAWLANKLDEDDWKTAERMLNGAVEATARPEGRRAVMEPKAINIPKTSEWVCHVFGRDGQVEFRPAKGGEPNWFHRQMQRLAFGCVWEFRPLVARKDELNQDPPAEQKDAAP